MGLHLAGRRRCVRPGDAAAADAASSRREPAQGLVPEAGLGAWTRLLDTTPLELFLTSLSNGGRHDPVGEARRPSRWMAQMGVPPQVDVAAWRAEIDVGGRRSRCGQRSSDADTRLEFFARRPADGSHVARLSGPVTSRAAAQDGIIEPRSMGVPRRRLARRCAAEHRDAPAYRERLARITCSPSCFLRSLCRKCCS